MNDKNKYIFINLWVNNGKVIDSMKVVEPLNLSDVSFQLSNI